MNKELAGPGYRNSKKGIRGQEKAEASISGGERNRKFKAELGREEEGEREERVNT